MLALFRRMFMSSGSAAYALRNQGVSRPELLAAAGLLFSACRAKPSPEEVELAEVRRLIKLDDEKPNMPNTGRYFPEQQRGWNGSYTLKAGVLVDDRLIYKVYGMPLGQAPQNREDAVDLHPGIPESVFSSCQRCGISWKWVNSHSTRTGPDCGVAPLCEKCWRELTPKQRVPFYELARIEYRWPISQAALEAAVLAEQEDRHSSERERSDSATRGSRPLKSGNT
jgi:hypothetical protein